MKPVGLSGRKEFAMTREEWYKHQTIDKIISVSEYVEIMLDDAMDTDMPAEKIAQLYNLLAELQCDINKQIR